MNATFERAWLDKQADQIEAALSSLSLGVRVSGGEVSRDRVRYHATPLVGTETRQVRDAARKVASAIGAERITVAEDREGIAIEVQLPEQGELRLLPMLHALGELNSLTAVLGLTISGNPLILNLRNSSTWHLVATGARGAGKSELIRSLAVCLALTSRESQLQLIGFDIGGRDLALLEALPHSLTDLASDAAFASELLAWVRQEVGRRLASRISRPDIVILVDDLSFAMHSQDAADWMAISDVLNHGKRVGMHLVAAVKDGVLPRELDPQVASGLVFAVGAAGGRPGLFEFQVGKNSSLGKVAWLTARDLDTAVELANAGWRTTLAGTYSQNGGHE